MISNTDFVLFYPFIHWLLPAGIFFPSLFLTKVKVGIMR